MAVRIATDVADADGVELMSSEPPSTVGDDTIKLDVTVEGERESVARAVAKIRDGLPSGATIDVVTA
jgi:hypothetical protein